MITRSLQTGSIQIIRRTRALYEAAQGHERARKNARALLQEKCIKSIMVNKKRWKPPRRKENVRFHSLLVKYSKVSLCLFYVSNLYELEQC